jgi:hypothetical protein
MGNVESTSSSIANDDTKVSSSFFLTAAAYAKESEEATANIAEVDHRRREVPHSSISIRSGKDVNQLQVIEAILPQQLLLQKMKENQQQQQQHHQTMETRDEPTENSITNGNDERSKTITNTSPAQQPRDPPIVIPHGSYKLTPREIISTTVSPPERKNNIASHLITRFQCGKLLDTKSRTKIVAPNNTIVVPVQQRQNQEQEQIDSATLSKQKDIEAKRILQNIINLDTDVTEATAAVYHYLETKRTGDEMSASGRARKVIGHIKNELRKGNSKPAYQFLETAKAVLPVLQEEAGMDLEAGIFSHDDDDDSEQSHIPPLQQILSISEQTAAIFQFLDDTKNLGKSGDTLDPIGSNETTGDAPSNIFRILEESDDMSKPLDLTDHIPMDDMDMEFVEHFDLAYSEFLFYHPKLVAKNPDLLNKLRIYKLQKLLEYNEILEQNLTEKFDLMNEEKMNTEEFMHHQLKDAARKKAAHQTFLQSEVNDIHWSTKKVQAELRWKLVKYSEDRAKRQFKLREQFKTIPQVNTRQELLQLVPEGPNGNRLKNAIKASFIAEGSSQSDNILSSRKEEQLRDIQVENSVVNTEIAMLNQKLTRLRIEANKLNWVQSILVRLDEGTMCKLKEQFRKKEGVVL